MSDDLRDDIPGARSTIEDVLTRSHLYFFSAMSAVWAVVFLIGMYELGPNQLKAVPDPFLLICVGMGGFSLFFPLFTAVYCARHLLHSVKELERRVEHLQTVNKQRPDNELKTSRKPKCIQSLVRKSFSRGARPKCLHASLGRNLKIHLLSSPLSGRCK